MRRSRQLGWRAMQIALLFALVACAAWMLRVAFAAPPPDQGPGGPILVVTSSSSTFGKYYAEILRTEGLNAFAVADVATLTPSTLSNYEVVVLAKTTLSAAQVAMLSDWVNAGGSLIAMGPDAQLAGLLGITPTSGSVANGYILVDSTTRPGNGIVNQTIQFHGSADLYTLAGASSIAALYSNATAPTGSPAVTLRAVGAGQAAAFAYDLATSIVYTRQGNPAWAAQERDSFTPIRSDDKFFGNAAGDPQPDWVDLGKVAIPQADEQQRLLANLIVTMNLAKKPLPRFWYFPNGKKAVVVMSGDDHGNGGTAGRFDQFKAASPAGCSVANWECVRGTSYVYPGTPLTDAQALAYTVDGFEVGLHVNTSCADFTPTSLEATYVQEIADWTAAFPSIPAPITQRHHCIVWSDWASGAQTEFNHGIRLDTSYYYWPPGWVNNVPGMFTGSAMPMRFSQLDGTLLDVYQATTQMTDESGQSYPFTVDTLLDRAVGPEGYYGAYVINAHTDLADSDAATAAVASAQARSVPVVSSKQMLDWLDGRNASSFAALAWDGTTLTFVVTPGTGANGLQAMLPTRSVGGALSAITRGGSPVAFTVSSIKGIEYAMFAATAGTYVATYASDTTVPSVTATSPSNGASNVALDVSVTASFDEAMDPSTITASTFELRGPSNALVAASITYVAATRTAALKPTNPLAASTAYTATVKGGATDPRVKDAAGNALAASVSWSFTTGAAPGCPCTVWTSATTPTNASAADPGAVELGVKFTADVNGVINAIRFYKGAANTGTHVGNLWTVGGQLLASVTFTGESATGWQQANFSTPVAITANTVYVASYFAPNGGYAFDDLFFANAGVDKPPLHLLRDGVNGGNGVYAYGPTSSFPASTYRSSNYWVDVSFTPGAVSDTTPPSVSATSPPNGAVGVSATIAVTTSFSEPLDATTVSTSTFELRDSTNALVPATVSYNAATATATLTPVAALAASSSYSATLHGGATDPRIKDVAGNALVANVSWSFATASAGGPCASPANAIVAENCQTGNPASEWDISGVGDPTIQGFATQISVNRGDTVFFKVDTPAANYRFDIYRMGYYGGLGARKVATVLPSASLPQFQPACLTQAATGLIDCGNWGVSGSWAVPATTVSGIYFAKVVRADTGGASHIVFIVRDDSGNSDLLFQTSDTTWQAYNNYGGNSLYTGSPGTSPSRAYKVSYNRPFNTRNVDNGQDWVFNAEYPMVRWLEANGYNVSYVSGADVDRSGSLLLNHNVYMSVGHDEYWSGGQRASVEAARNAGVNLAFFSGNEIFWKTRWENSIDGASTPYRTLVSYKETHANAVIDPQDPPTWTGTWRDPRFSPPADGGRPENALAGTFYMVNNGATTSITVPAEDGKMRFWRNTSVANLAAGNTATLPDGTLGYEWDVGDADNGFRPAGLFRMSTTVVTGAPVLQDFGSTYGSGTATHALTFYLHGSGARVFGAGTVQWAWGLDSTHDRAGTASDVRMQQATVNLFADMNVQPATLQAGLVAASASTDTAAPTSTITSPAPGSTVPVGPVTITGTAADSGGGIVGGVEVSVDGGTTWHPANGRAAWTYNWTATATGSVTIKSRAVDDSGNLELPGAGVTLTIGTRTCPCTIWPPSATPTTVTDPDTGAVNLGVKFTADQDGFITGIRFYKGPTNTGTHIGALWTSAGVQLASATFTNETASGWQQVDFLSPVAVTANTVYVASYLAPNGRYAADSSFFAAAGVDNPPLHALRDGASGGNGVYAYSTSLTFPSSTFQASNYWVDVVFGPDTTPPTVTGTTPANGATGVAVTSAVTATFSEAVDPATAGASTFELRDAGNALVGASVTYNASTRTATLTPTAALAGSTTYTATVKGGATDPRIKDLAGNALAANAVWSFTTAAVDTTPPTVTAVTPPAGATAVSVATTVTATFSESMDATTVASTTSELRDPANALVAATVTYSAATLTATLTPTAALAVSTTYAARVRGGTVDPRVKDAAGNALAADRVWSFTTAASSDTTPPTVTAISPANGATGVSSTTTVTATFGEAMDPTTIAGSTFELRDPTSALVAATVTYNATTRVATLTPSNRLAAATTYTAKVKGGSTDPRAKDLAGNALAADRTWSFTVDSTPPTVTAVSPANNATGVSSTTTVTATFSEAMDPTTISTITFELRDPANALVAASVTYNATTRVATLTPTSRLAAATTYTARVRGGSADPRAKDLAGNALAADRVWSFTIDATAPTVTAISPASGATGIGATTTVTATFSEAVGAATIDTTTFELRDPSNALVAATVTYNATTRVATLTPSARLNAATTYTARVRGGAVDPRVKDVAGNALATDRVWSFTIDSTPPTVTAVTPLNGATGVARTSSVTATFSEAMDATTINTTTFELRNPSNVLVPATVSYSATNRRATLNPNSNLAAGTTYTATVKGGTADPRVKDANGNALVTNQTWTFRTR